MEGTKLNGTGRGGGEERRGREEEEKRGSEEAEKEVTGGNQDEWREPS